MARQWPAGLPARGELGARRCALGRVIEADYARLLGMARDAGINFLRVWGGGVREKRAFWDICDRLGIMAWQEFPPACAFMDHYPRDRAYLDVLAAEARGTVRALRNHPSLIAWCGGNEISPWREHLPLEALAAVLVEEDPTRPWIPASPCDGDLHHWQVWHGLAPWTDLAGLDAPFMSEFGLQALPDVATVTEMFPGDAPVSLSDPALGRAQGPGRKAALLRGSGCWPFGEHRCRPFGELRCWPFDRLRARSRRRHRGHAARPGDGAAGRDRGVPAAEGDAVWVCWVTGRCHYRRGVGGVFTNANSVLSVPPW